MLDPRIYRTGFVAVALAVIVFAFSLTDQQGALTPTLAPEAFNGPNAYTLMNALARTYPERRPGSTGDDALAADIAARLRRIHGGYSVSTSLFKARTSDGTRTLENITAVRAGQVPGSVVVVSHRDSLGAGSAAAELSGAATMLELARVLAGETQHRTIVLASTSGSSGASGAIELARTLPGPVDAVIVLGDLAGTRVHQPVVVPWSDRQQVAPPILRNTVAGALASQAALRVSGTTLGGQFVHLAFPFTLSDQGPFDARGMPAVSLSLAGDGAPGAQESTSPRRITASGRTLLATISALDSAPDLPRTSAYVLFSGKVIPAWSISLLVLTLILPVLLATLDGVARARRRGHSVTRGIAWVLAAAVPFVLAAALAVLSRLLGWVTAAPPAPVAGGAVPLHGGGIALLIAVAAVIALAFAAARPFVIWLVRAHQVANARSDPSEAMGAAAGVLLVLCAVALAMWASNPFAAAFLVPALHLWMWVVDPELRLHPAATLALLLAGLAPPVLLVLYYAHALSLGPLDLVWNGFLLTAGGHVGLVAALEYCILLGCLVSVLLIAWRKRSLRRREQGPVTVRGPVTYAGPGSLGGTESALKIRR